MSANQGEMAFALPYMSVADSRGESDELQVACGICDYYLWDDSLHIKR